MERGTGNWELGIENCELRTIDLTRNLKTCEKSIYLMVLRQPFHLRDETRRDSIPIWPDQITPSASRSPLWVNTHFALVVLGHQWVLAPECTCSTSYYGPQPLQQFEKFSGIPDTFLMRDSK